MVLTEAPRHVQSEDARKTIALMDAKIRRLQGIILRSQPQEELKLRTIQSLEQVPLLKHTCRDLLGGLVSGALCCSQSLCRLGIHTLGQRLLPYRRHPCVNIQQPVTCRMQELALMRGGSGLALGRASSLLPRRPSADRGHLRATRSMQRMPSAEPADAPEQYGEVYVADPDTTGRC